jgi:hypothetical protein
MFNNSSKHFFISRNGEFLKYKKQIDSISLSLDRNKLENLVKLLNDNEESNITDSIIYVGISGKLKYDTQINTICEYIFQDEDAYIVQKLRIEFVGVEYDCDKPTLFSKFSHSTSIEDIKDGFDGIHHKCLLTNIVRAISENGNIWVLTPKSPESGKIILKTLHEKPRMLSFSVSRGLREKYRKIENLIYENRECYKEFELSESNYITCPKDIFLCLFKKSEYDYNKFSSFIGLFQYMKNEFDENVINKIYEYIMLQCFGKYSSQLFNNDYIVDESEKFKMIEYFWNNFGVLNVKSRKSEYIEMCSHFYSNYGDVNLKNIIEKIF